MQQNYVDLRAVISIHFLFFELLRDLPDDTAYHHVFRLRADSPDGKGPVLSPHIEIHTVEMTKFPDVKDGEDEVKWVYWLKHGQQMTEQEVASLGVPEIMEAERKLAMISQDRSLRVEHQRREIARLDSEGRERDIRVDAERRGKREGVLEGERVVRQVILDLCELLGLEVSSERRTRLDSLPLEELDALRQQIKQQRAWPAD